MRNISIALIILSAIGFILAIISAYAGTLGGIAPEGFSRGCTNLALISIALGIWLKKEQ